MDDKVLYTLQKPADASYFAMVRGDALPMVGDTIFAKHPKSEGDDIVWEIMEFNVVKIVHHIEKDEKLNTQTDRIVVMVDFVE